MQLVNINKRSSDAYIGSIDTGSVSDMEQLQDIRTYVKVMNKHLRDADARDRRGKPLRYRVTLKGREAIEKQTIPAYSWHKEKWEQRPRSYNVFGDILGGLANAKRIDVYIHRRMDY